MEKPLKLDELERSGDWAAALNELHPLLSARPNDPQLWCLKGYYLAKQQLYKPSLESYNNALACSEDHLEAQLGKARMLLMLRQAAAAVDIYEGILKRDPSCVGAWMLKVLHLQLQGQPRKTLDLLEEIVELFPAESEVRLARIRTYLLLNEPMPAFRDLQMVQLWTPDHPDLELLKPQVLRRMGKVEEARDVLQERVEREPYRAELYVEYAELLGSLGEYPEALKNLDAALLHDAHNPDLLLLRARTLARMRRSDEAREAFGRLLREFPNRAEANLAFAHLLQQQEEYEEALKFVEAAQRLSPSLEGWRLQAHLLQDLKRHTEALTVLDQALNQFPKNVDLLFDKAGLLEEMGRLSDCLGIYDLLIGLMPKDARPYYQKYVVYSRLGQLDAAVHTLELITAFDPDNPAVWYNKGFVYKSLGKHKDARAALARAIELNPNQARSWYFKAMFYASINDRANTLHYLNKAIELQPNYAHEAHEEEVFEPYLTDPSFLKLVASLAS